MFHLIIAPIIITAIIISIIVRLILRPLINPYRLNRPYYGPYGFFGYGRGYRRHRFPGGLLSIAILVAIDRLLGRRW
jgi:hypothetical protein